MRGDIEKRTNIRAIILRAIGTSKNHSRVPFRFESAELLDCDPTRQRFFLWSLVLEFIRDQRRNRLTSRLSVPYRVERFSKLVPSL
jgi:hypothetical protein